MRLFFILILLCKFIFAEDLYPGYLGTYLSPFRNSIDTKEYIYGITASGVKVLKKEENNKVKEISNVDISANIEKGIIYDNSYLVLRSKNRIFFIDIKDPLKPFEISSLDIVNSDIAVKGDCLYVTVTSYDDPSIIYDISDMQNVKKIGEFEKGKNYEKVYIKNNRMIITSKYAGFDLYDVSDPSHPKFVIHKSVSDGGSDSIYIDDKDRLYFGNYNLNIYDLNDTENNITQIAHFSSSNFLLSFIDFKVYKDHVIAVDGKTSSRVAIIDISDLNISTIKYYSVGESNIYEYSLTQDSEDPDIFYLSTDIGLKEMNVSDINSPKFDTFVDMPRVKAYNIIKDHLLVVDSARGIYEYLLEDGYKPKLVKILGLEDEQYGRISSLYYKDGYLYVMYWYAIVIYDAKDIENPVKLGVHADYNDDGTLNTSYGSFNSLCIRDNLMYLFKGSSYLLRVIDISDKSNPVEVNRLKLKGDYVSSPIIVGNYLYAIVYKKYFAIFDIKDKENPKYVGNLDIYGLKKIVTDGKKVFAIGFNSIRVYDLDKDGKIDTEHVVEYKNYKLMSTLDFYGSYLIANYNYENFYILQSSHSGELFDIAKPNAYDANSVKIYKDKIFMINTFHHSGITVANIDDMMKHKTMHFTKGWNLKASPVYYDINVTDIPCQIFWKWDYIDKKWQYSSKDENISDLLKDSYETFDMVTIPEGFWAYCQNDTNLSLPGVGSNLLYDNYSDGWKLVGFSNDINTSDLIDSPISTMWSFSQGKWHLWCKNMQESAKYEKLENIKAEDGVWINIKK